MSFWVLDVEAGPPRIRGALSRWAVEVRAGLYIGCTSAKTRDAIWAVVEREVAVDARALLAFPSSRHVMGFEVRTVGPGRRLITDVDGLLLARFLPEPPRAVATPRDVGATEVGDGVAAVAEEWPDRVERRRDDEA